MVISGTQFAAVVIICLFVGIVIGMLVWFLFGIPRCEHIWEKVIDDKASAGTGHVVVYMCTKCGKTKTIKINL